MHNQKIKIKHDFEKETKKTQTHTHTQIKIRNCLVGRFHGHGKKFIIGIIGIYICPLHAHGLIGRFSRSVLQEGKALKSVN